MNTHSTESEQPRVVVLKSSAPRAIEWAAERLADGGVIAMPTDTVYGIAASLAHPGALQRLSQIKRRVDLKPIPVLISSADAIDHLTEDVPDEVSLLLAQFWPGPLTVVLPARAGMPPDVTGGAPSTGGSSTGQSGRTIGLRVPNHPLAIEIIAKAGGAIACTSANRTGEPPAVRASQVAGTLGPELDLILDGGITRGGVASTVVAFDGEALSVLREGPIATETLSAAWAQLLAGRG